MTEALTRIASLCVLLACAETLHGIARTVLVVPRIGKDRAIKLSALTGSILAFLICYVLVPPIGLKGPIQHVALGGILATFMALFDLGIGLMVMRKSWRKVMNDFDPRTGELSGLWPRLFGAGPCAGLFCSEHQMTLAALGKGFGMLGQAER